MGNNQANECCNEPLQHTASQKANARKELKSKRSHFPEKDGMLCKKGEMRYFKLRFGRFSYKVNKEDKGWTDIPMETMDPTSVTSLREATKFTVEIKQEQGAETNRVYELTADSGRERKEWVNALRDTIMYLQKEKFDEQQRAVQKNAGVESPDGGKVIPELLKPLDKEGKLKKKAQTVSFFTEAYPTRYFYLGSGKLFYMATSEEKWARNKRNEVKWFELKATSKVFAEGDKGIEFTLQDVIEGSTAADPQQRSQVTFKGNKASAKEWMEALDKSIARLANRENAEIDEMIKSDSKEPTQHMHKHKHKHKDKSKQESIDTDTNQTFEKDESKQNDIDACAWFKSCFV